jgi:catalase
MTILMSDRGIPLSYRHVHGFSSHTLSFYNAKGERFWCKWHFKTNQGIKTLTNEEASKMPANGAQKDLVDAIDRGDFPSWRVEVQIMTEAQAKTYHINPFDLTKIWPYKDFPVIEIGKLELSKNVNNYFAETEQVAFAPSNFVPGINASPDKMLQGRLLAYQDAHRYRIGANFNQIPVNAGKCPVNHYQRDGAFAGMGCPVGHSSDQASYTNAAHTVSASNFYPNDRAAAGAPVPAPEVAVPPMPVLEDAWIRAYDQSEEDYHSQAGDLFRIMNDDQKQQLFNNIAGGLSQASKSIQERMLAQFAKADPAYAEGVKSAIAAIK